MESIDDLLAEVKAEFEKPAQPLTPKKQPPLSGEQFRQAAAPAPMPLAWEEPAAFSPEGSLLSQLKAEFEEQARQEQLKKEQELRSLQHRQEQQRQQQREALRKQAEAWLKNLEPHSEEGLWFEEFAYQYPSKLEAAQDYLQALQQTKL